MMDNLKPCPFCGGKVKINYDINLEPFGVYCHSCRMLAKFNGIKPIGNGEAFGRYMEDLTEAWNRRTE